MTKPEISGNGTVASVHLVLQGKGGVGKSFVSAILAQYFRTKAAPVHCLVEKACHGDGVFIVDTGATTFVPLWNYILENEILDFFRAHGRSVFVHSVVTGGQAMTDTLNGLERLAQTTSQKNVIVWLNEYFGEVTKDGKTFEEFKVAEEYAPKLVGTVVIRDRNPHTYGDDIRQMLEQRLTFDEAIKDGRFFLVSKQRLAIVRRELFEQLDKLAIT